jgi:hypothetical protein
MKAWLKVFLVGRVEKRDRKVGVVGSKRLDIIVLTNVVDKNVIRPKRAAKNCSTNEVLFNVLPADEEGTVNTRKWYANDGVC